jgi:sugar lactone lactonase YvrE
MRLAMIRRKSKLVSLMGSVASFSVGALVFSACASQPPPEPAPLPAPEPPPAPVATEQPLPPPAEPAKPAAPPPPTPVVTYSEGISTPESVLYDAANDRYLVSNVNGKPLEADNNGFISELSPDGKITKLKFIAGGENKVKLDAPKGSGIFQGTLYVTDITVVRKFDLKTGAPKGEIPIPGTSFLNDLSIAPDGRVFVSDSGWKAGANGFEGTGTDAIYMIKNGKVTQLAKSPELGEPNGVLFTEKGLLAGTGNKNELYRLDDKGARQDVTAVPDGGLDGIAVAGDKLLVSSWKSSTVYRGTLGGTFEPVVWGVSAPADIGFDSKRSRILVPRFMDSLVQVYDLK